METSTYCRARWKIFNCPGAFLKVGQTLLKACINILTHYKMIEGTPHYPEIRYKGFQQALLAPKSGVFLLIQIKF